MPAYALAWLAFGIVHSLSARDAPKALLRRLTGRATRLAWNLIALAQLAAVLEIGRATVARTEFDRPEWLAALQVACLLAGAIVLVRCRQCYDLGRLAGLTQLREDTPDDEPFRATGLLAYVRHPLYLGCILFLAGLVRDPLSLQTALFATAYFLVGLHFEERALLRRLGPAYTTYRACVPALLPWRGRALPET